MWKSFLLTEKCQIDEILGRSFFADYLLEDHVQEYEDINLLPHNVLEC